MEIVWVQTFGSGREIVSFVGENPTEEDINLFWNDLDETKRFMRAEVNEKSRDVEKVLDVESGQDLTNIPWARQLITSVLENHHS